ncbi:MAG TPA: hypothetical protein VGM50_20155 [Gemmatimonadaceae bacterium]|jgi:hypothetical protein
MKKDLRLSRSRQIATAVVAVVTAILAACSDAAAPVAPSANRSVDTTAEESFAKIKSLADLIPDSYIAQGLLRNDALDAAITVTKSIKSSGGTIDVPGADFQLVVPKGAFLSPSMTFTVTALPGSAVAYNFEPHGSTFLVPLQFVQKLGHTNLKGAKLLPGFHPEISGAYFTDPSMIDTQTGLALVAELLPADVDASIVGNKLTFPIWHFSGYMASTGRR